MNEKMFWWSPTDPTGGSSILYFVDENGHAIQEHEPQFGDHNIVKLLERDYMEISWKTARAMGAPY